MGGLITQLITVPYIQIHPIQTNTNTFILQDLFVFWAVYFECLGLKKALGYWPYCIETIKPPSTKSKTTHQTHLPHPLLPFITFSLLPSDLPWSISALSLIKG